MPVKAIFLDISGVLLDGSTPLPGAAQAIQLIQQSGMPYRLVTNTSQQTCAMLHAQLAEAGLKVDISHIYTAPLAAHDYLVEQGLRPYCLIHDNLRSEFADLDQQNPNAVVIGDAAEGFTYQRLNEAFRICLQGAPLIAIGHNKYFKKDNVFYMDAGPFVEAIEYACDIEAIITGKPSPAFFEQVLNSVQLPASDVALIGDDVYGDIQGAMNSGMQSRLVTTGKYRANDESRVEPAAIVVKDVMHAVNELLV